MFDGRLGIGGQFFGARRPLQRVQKIFAAVAFYRLVKIVAHESRPKIFVDGKSVSPFAKSYHAPEKFFVQKIFFVQSGEDVSGELGDNSVAAANFCAENERYERVDKFYKSFLVEMIFLEAVEQIHQNDRGVVGFEQINELIKFFVERGKIFELRVVVKDKAAEKFCIAEQIFQTSFDVVEIVREKFFERVGENFGAEKFWGAAEYFRL